MTYQDYLKSDFIPIAGWHQKFGIAPRPRDGNGPSHRSRHSDWWEGRSKRRFLKTLIPPWARRHPFPQGRVLARY